jgi:hypothetical protein
VEALVAGAAQACRTSLASRYAANPASLEIWLTPGLRIAIESGDLGSAAVRREGLQFGWMMNGRPAPAPIPAPSPSTDPEATPASGSPPSPATTGSGVTVQMQLSSQWNGAFEGQLVLTNQTNQPLATWSASFTSRYELRGVSDFSLQQQRQADGTWLVTISPPSWGGQLQVGTPIRSYVQGIIDRKSTRLNSSH